VRVIGLDLGTQCGYAWTDNGKVEPAFSGVWDFKPRRFEGGGMRYLRFKGELMKLIEPTEPGSRAVFFEEVVAHRGVAAAHAYGGFFGILTELCECWEIPYQGIPVGTIKKRATLKGNANKAMMQRAAFNAWGVGMTEDQADACWTLVCGLEQLGELAGS